MPTYKEITSPAVVKKNKLEQLYNNVQWIKNATFVDLAASDRADKTLAELNEQIRKLEKAK